MLKKKGGGSTTRESTWVAQWVKKKGGGPLQEKVKGIP